LDNTDYFENDETKADINDGNIIKDKEDKNIKQKKDNILTNKIIFDYLDNNFTKKKLVDIFKYDNNLTKSKIIGDLVSLKDNRNKVRRYMKSDPNFKEEYEELKKKQQIGTGIKKLNKKQRKAIILGEINAGNSNPNLLKMI